MRKSEIPTIQIRRAVAGDADILAQFNCAMALETESVTLDPAPVLQGVRVVLADLNKGFYLVAAAGDEIIGQLLITREWSDWRNGDFWWIQSVYIAPDSRRQGVFRRLYAEVLAEARADPQVCGVRLYVEEDNQKARRIYERLGMIRTPYRLYELDFVLAAARDELRER